MRRRKRQRGHARSNAPPAGFSLVELLVVIAIIALLIGMLTPSLNKARQRAKDVRVRGEHRGIETGLEQFFNDHDEYPPSFLRDPTTGAALPDPIGSAGSPGPANQVLSGAHYLARALVGRDLKGYAEPGTGPDADLYELDPPTTGQPVYDRSQLYVNPEEYTLVKDDANSMEKLPVNRVSIIPATRTGELMFLDFYKYPILYYRADPRATRILTDTSNPLGKSGVYDHQHNEYFTGDGGSNAGWEFKDRPHEIAEDGYAATYVNEPAGHTFLAYIYNRQTWANTADATDKNGRLEPYRKNTYLLISAGYDGILGTNDDIKNFGGK